VSWFNREWRRIIDESLQNLQAHFWASALEEWR